MSKNECVFCGKIGYRCPNKNFNGICRTNGEINEHGEKQPCKHTVTIKDGSSAFFAKHLYTIRNNKPHQISPISQPVNIYPNYLYCANIDTFCPYQSPGGKCTLIQFMQGRDVSTTCCYQIYLDIDTELVTRLIQFVHKDIDQLRKEKEKLLKQIEQLKQNQK